MNGGGEISYRRRSVNAKQIYYYRKNLTKNRKIMVYLSLLIVYNKIVKL